MGSRKTRGKLGASKRTSGGNRSGQANPPGVHEQGKKRVMTGIEPQCSSRNSRAGRAARFPSCRLFSSISHARNIKKLATSPDRGKRARVWDRSSRGLRIKGGEFWSAVSRLLARLAHRLIGLIESIRCSTSLYAPWPARRIKVITLLKGQRVLIARESEAKRERKKKKRRGEAGESGKAQGKETLESTEV